MCGVGQVRELVGLRAGRSLIDLIDAPAGPREGGGNMDYFALRIGPFDEAAIRAHLEAEAFAYEGSPDRLRVHGNHTISKIVGAANK